MPHHITLHHTTLYSPPFFHTPLACPPHTYHFPSNPLTPLTPSTCHIIPHYTLSDTPHPVHPVAGVSMDTGSTGAYLSPGSLSSKVGRKPGHRERILAYSTVGYGIICCIFVIFSQLIIQFFSIFHFFLRILEHPTTSLLKC